MAELPSPAGFDAASKSVTEEEIAAQLPCGPDVSKYVEAVKEFLDAGFTDVGLVQVDAAQQDAFLDWAQRELLPDLRELGGYTRSTQSPPHRGAHRVDGPAPPPSTAQPSKRRGVSSGGRHRLGG